jgi:hypothetical protein
MGEHYFDLGAFCVDQPSRTLSDMSFEGANYAQYYPQLFFEVEQHHAREICLKGYTSTDKNMVWKHVKGI